MINRTLLALLVCLFAASGARAQRSTLKSYCSWPIGLSVSILTPDEKLAAVKAAGFDWVETTLNSQRKTSEEQRRNVIAKFGELASQNDLRIWSVHLPFGRDWDISTTDEAKRARCVAEIAWFIEAVKSLCPQKLILHPSFEPLVPAERAAHIESCIRSINELAATARKIGAQLLIEDLPRTCLGNTSDEMLAILGRVDRRVGVCFDTNHLLQESPQAFAQAVGRRIASLHVSDYDNTDEKHWLMGRGVIDWPAVIAALAQARYKGVFMFEVGGYDSYDQIVESWHTVKRQLETNR